MTRLLYIAYVWPEPTSSAAGVRTLGVLDALTAAGWQVTVASSAKSNAYREALNERGLETCEIQLNDSTFDAWVAQLAPQVAVFDRFVTEEQYSWRIRQAVPQCLRIIDTQDLHFVRKTRDAKRSGGRVFAEEGSSSLALYSGDETWRELAAILRSDWSWLVSDFEYRLLVEHFGVPAHKLTCVPFGVAPTDRPRPYTDRSGFVVLGNFRHPPNYDGVRWLREEIWPTIRSRLPGAELQVWGAYPPKECMNWDDPPSGFRVRGWAKSAADVFSSARVSLAPLRFGAGIKGKVLESWSQATPCVSTTIGAESLGRDGSWPGAIVDDPAEFARLAVLLHESQEVWSKASRAALTQLALRFAPSSIASALTQGLEHRLKNYRTDRDRDVLASILWSQTLRSTEYFSRWLELKEKR